MRIVDKQGFVRHVAGAVAYWDQLPAGPFGPHNQRERLQGLAFTILAALDGCAEWQPELDDDDLAENELHADFGPIMREVWAESEAANGNIR